MKRSRILSIGPLPEDVVEKLLPFAAVEQLDDSDRQAVVEAADESVLLIIARGSVMVDSEILDRTPRLKAVARTGVGYDSVRIEDATERRIPVLYTPGAMTRAVAEHTVAFILGAYKQLDFWKGRLAAGDWGARYRCRSLDLQGSTVGIIGYGRIGRQVRLLLQPFEVEVLADDPYIDQSKFVADQVTFVDLDGVLTRSDIVTLHVPLTGETRHLLNRQTLSRMPSGSVLVNTARGGVIESLDLVLEALESEHLSYAALDVFPDEPPGADHPLFRHPRCLATGHVASRSPRAQRGILETMLEDALALLSGRKPRIENVVNPEVFS